MNTPRFEDRAPVRVAGPRGFRLNKRDGKIMGVSAGLADRFGWNVTVIRVAWVLGTLAGFGSLILVYLAIGFIAD